MANQALPRARAETAPGPLTARRGCGDRSLSCLAGGVSARGASRKNRKPKLCRAKPTKTNAAKANFKIILKAKPKPNLNRFKLAKSSAIKASLKRLRRAERETSKLKAVAC